MQRRRGRIEADIAGHDLFAGQCIQRGGVGYLMDIAAGIERAEQIGLVFGHNGRAPSMGAGDYPQCRVHPFP